MFDLSTVSLSRGAHATAADGVCALEAVAALAGEPHSDRPRCASPVIAAFLRTWSDALPDDATRTRLLVPLLPEVVGTRASAVVEEARAWRCLDWAARDHAPAWLAVEAGCADHAATLRALSPIHAATWDEHGERITRACEAAHEAATAIGDASAEAPRHAARAAARLAAWDAARAAGRVVDWDSRRVVAWHATRTAAWDAAATATPDALTPTVAAMQASAVALVRELCQLTDAPAR
jgi:hypothetical protein